MSTGLKIVLWIVGGIAALLILLVIAAFFFGRSMMDDVQEASTFGANATHEECASELAKRANACDGINCILQASVFGAGCLGAAQGDREQFCASVPAPSDSAEIQSWSGDFCAKHELNKDSCDISGGVVVAFCAK